MRHQIRRRVGRNMKATTLLSELAELHIRLHVIGGHLRFAPRSEVTTDLAHRMRIHKTELLKLLLTEGSSVAIPPYCPHCNGLIVIQPTVDGYLNFICDACDRCPGCKPVCDRDASQSMPSVPVVDISNIDEVVDYVDACSTCRSFDLWQTLLGKWKCVRCDPPTTARRIRDRRQA